MPLGTITRNKVLPAISIILVAISVTQCGRNPGQREARFLSQGKAQLAKKDYARAILEFRNASQVMPRDAEPYYQSALVYLELRDARNAVKLLRKAVELNPKHEAAQLKLAAFELGSTDPKIVEGASERVQQVLSSTPGNADATELLAISEFRMGKMEDALRDLQNAVDKSPEHLRAAFALAKVKLAQRDASSAEAVLKKAAQSMPKSVEPALALAQFYLAVGRKAEGEAQVRRALQLDPKSASALLSLATIQINARQMSDAEQTYRQISTLPDPSLKPLHAVFIFQQGSRDEAIGELAKLAKKNPAERRIRGLLVSAYLTVGRERDARHLLDETLKHNPRDTDALLQRSELNLQSGNLDQVVEDLNNVLHSRPESGEVRYGLARVYGQKGQLPNQRQQLGEALKRNPGLLPARLDLARLLLRMKDAPAALEVLNQVPPAQTGTPAYIAARNWVLMALDKPSELRQSIDVGLMISNAPEIRYQDALVRLNHQDYAGARKVLEALMADFPESTSSLDLLAQTYAATGDTAKALGVVSEYASRRPKSPYLNHLLGTWYLRTKSPQQARQAFVVAADLNRDYLPPALLLSEMDLTDGKLDASRRTLQQILSRHPENLRARYLLGLVEDRSGNQAAAEACYRFVVDRDSSNADALNNLAYLLISTNPDEAVKYGQMALEKAPENPAALDTLGWVYYRKHVYSSALNYLKQAVDKEPTAVRRYHLALAYRKLGDTAEARKNLALAVQLDPKVVNQDPMDQ
jgi:tetratricopeptide (TPR) repeat protein